MASFIAKVDREVAARVEARLAATAPAPPAKTRHRRSLVKGLAIGACTGALAATIAIGLPRPSGQGKCHRNPESEAFFGDILASSECTRGRRAPSRPRRPRHLLRPPAS